VARGVGIAPVPRLAHDQAPPEVRLRELDPPLKRRVPAVVRSGSERRPAVSVFLDGLRQAGAGYAASWPDGQ
jgi:DNA-binding transcriptional LysR family regulator